MCFKCLTHWIGSSDSDFVLVFKCYYIIICLAIVFRFKLFETRISFIWLCLWDPICCQSCPTIMSPWTQPQLNLWQGRLLGLCCACEFKIHEFSARVDWVGSWCCYWFLGWFLSFRHWLVVWVDFNNLMGSVWSFTFWFSNAPAWMTVAQN